MCFVVAGLLTAQRMAWSRQVSPHVFNGVEALTGFGDSQLEEKGAYQSVPLFIDFDFNLKALAGIKDFYPPGILQFQVEPFIAGVFEPKANLETGNSFFLKVGVFPETWKFQPYIKAGIGAAFMTEHAAEQATQWNFIESYVVGAHYFLTDAVAVTAEGRFRHMSNAGRKLPNHGINTDLYLAGVSYFF